MGIVDVFVFKMVDSSDVIDEFLEDMGNLTDNLNRVFSGRVFC